MKAITYLLAVIFIVLGVIWFTNGSKSSIPETLGGGQPLKLLYELSDAELAELTMQVGVLEPDLESSAADAGGDLSQPLIESSAVELEPEPVLELEPVCYLVGEVRDAAIAATLGAQLERSGYEVSRTTRFVEEPGPYVVFIDPQPSSAEANALVASLESNGIESIIIRDPPRENGLSLGIFRSEENSAGLVSRARALGFDVKRSQSLEEIELFRFFLSGSEANPIGANFWQQIRTEFEGVQVEEKSCEEVASTGNFQ